LAFRRRRQIASSLTRRGVNVCHIGLSDTRHRGELQPNHIDF
jgi:hypothetical protein